MIPRYNRILGGTLSGTPLGVAVVAWWLAPHLNFRSVHDPNAAPRPVAARGDLMELEKTTIDIFKASSPSVVHITTLALGEFLVFAVEALGLEKPHSRQAG